MTWALAGAAILILWFFAYVFCAAARRFVWEDAAETTDLSS